MKFLNVRVNDNLQKHIVVDGVPHEIQLVYFPSPNSPHGAIVSDIERQLEPDYEVCSCCGGVVFDDTRTAYDDLVFCDQFCELDYLSNR